MTVEDSEEDGDVNVAQASSVENDRPRNGVSDTSDTESVNVPTLKVRKKLVRTSQRLLSQECWCAPGTSLWKCPVDQVNMRDVFERRAAVMRTPSSSGAFSQQLSGWLSMSAHWVMRQLIRRGSPVLGSCSSCPGCYSGDLRVEARSRGSKCKHVPTRVCALHIRHPRKRPASGGESVETIWIDAFGGRCSWSKWENVQQVGKLSKGHRAEGNDVTLRSLQTTCFLS